VYPCKFSCKYVTGKLKLDTEKSGKSQGISILKTAEHPVVYKTLIQLSVILFIHSFIACVSALKFSEKYFGGTEVHVTSSFNRLCAATASLSDPVTNPPHSFDI